MADVWTYLANWLVQDGEIPELHTGDVLRGVALRAASWSLRESQGPEAVKEHRGDEQDSQLGTSYAVTGTVEATCEPGSVLLRVGNFRLVAEPNTVREVGGDGALEHYSPNFRIPRVGARATVSCTLDVMAAYETESTFLGVPTAGLARDWLVERIRVARWALTPTPGYTDRSTAGPLLDVEEIARIHRWADERDPAGEKAAYLLDLRTTN